MGRKKKENQQSGSIVNKESQKEPKTISLDEFMDFMRMFLNRLYPQPGYRVTAMTYMKNAIYMKITKDDQTMIEDAEWT